MTLQCENNSDIVCDYITMFSLSFALRATLGLKFSSATRNIRQVLILQISCFRLFNQHQHTFYLTYLSLGFTLGNVVIATVDAVYHGLDTFLRIVIHHQVGLSDWGKFGQDGVEEKVLSFPYRQNSWIFNWLQSSWLKKFYRLRFHPTGNITFSDNYVRPTNQDLVTIPSGSVLYQVVTRQHRRLNICRCIGWNDKYSICQLNQYIYKYWDRGAV